MQRKCSPSIGIREPSRELLAALGAAKQAGEIDSAGALDIAQRFMLQHYSGPLGEYQGRARRERITLAGMDFELTQAADWQAIPAALRIDIQQRQLAMLNPAIERAHFDTLAADEIEANAGPRAAARYRRRLFGRAC